jgi:uncharacterized protein
MLNRLPVLLALLLGCIVARGADSVPSEESIRQLLTVTNVHKLLDNMIPQVDAMLQKGVTQALQGQTISPDAQKKIDQNHADVMAVLHEELVWSKMEPLYIRIYQKSLTQEEVNGMIALYQTPAGQAMINKMPIVVQNTMAEVQTLISPTMQRLQQSQAQLVAEIKTKAKPKS